ncbi:MAG: hypothetical protein AABY74_02565 [Planctomycetota bacterium]
MKKLTRQNLIGFLAVGVMVFSLAVAGISSAKSLTDGQSGQAVINNNDVGADAKGTKLCDTFGGFWTIKIDKKNGKITGTYTAVGGQSKPAKGKKTGKNLDMTACGFCDEGYCDDCIQVVVKKKGKKYVGTYETWGTGVDTCTCESSGEVILTKCK